MGNGNNHRYSATSRAIGCGQEKYDMDDCRTPQGIFNAIDNMYHFTLDVCANEDNTKCDMYYDKEINGLSQPWFDRVWLAPPFSNRQVTQWLTKAVYETTINDDTVVWALVRNGATRWLKKYRDLAMEYCILTPEVQFDNPRNKNISHPMCLLRFGGMGPRVVSFLSKDTRTRNWNDTTYCCEYANIRYVMSPYELSKYYRNRDPTFI